MASTQDVQRQDEVLHTSEIPEDEYQYDPLPDPEAIRVLLIYPSRRFNAPAICDLEIAHSTSSTEYTALSYSWGMNEDGDDSLCRHIFIGGKVKRVTQNLFEAIRRLRHGCSDAVFRIWADAVSINQTDLVERSEQVANMATIFAHATSTVAWLGEGDDPDEDRAILSMTLCLSQGYDNTHDSDEHCWKSATGDMVTLCRSFECPVSPFSARERTAAKEELAQKLRALFNRRYFTRRWIVQELFQLIFSEGTLPLGFVQSPKYRLYRPV